MPVAVHGTTGFHFKQIGIITVCDRVGKIYDKIMHNIVGPGCSVTDYFQYPVLSIRIKMSFFDLCPSADDRRTEWFDRRLNSIFIVADISCRDSIIEFGCKHFHRTI